MLVENLAKHAEASPLPVHYNSAAKLLHLLFDQMPDLSPPFVSSAFFVVQFAKLREKVRLDAGRAEDAFRGFVHDQSQQTNVPDNAPPQIPRILFNGSKKSISISQMAVQLDLQFQPGEKAFKDQLGIVKKNATEFAERLEAGFDVAFGFRALVIQVHLSSKMPQREVQQYLYDQIVKKPAPLPVASFQSAMGFAKNDCFVNLNLSVFERRELMVKADGNSTVFTTDEMPVVDSGVNITIDINNKPTQAKDEHGVFPSKFFDLADEFMRKEVVELVGISLLG